MRWSFLMCAAGLGFAAAACGGGASGDTSNTGGSGGAGGAGGEGGTGGNLGCVLNGEVSGPEQCDDGNEVDGDGCDKDCTFSCVDAATDCAKPADCTMVACSKSHVCEASPDPAQDGAACGADGVCKAGVCEVAACGNGKQDAGEDCDFGAANGPGTGCESDCKFSCDVDMDLCSDGDPCNGVEACADVVVDSKTGRACVKGQDSSDCALCNGGVCKSGACVVSACNDGCVDPVVGEECEPPGSMTCDATCKNVVAADCGNGTRSATEQCDDGNNINLDGCDSTCKFEQSQRTNYVSLQFATDAFCGNSNQIGAAIASVAQSTFQMTLAQGVTAGTSGMIFKVVALDDLTGQNDPAAALGFVNGVKAPGAGYNGNNDVDWWYTIDPMWLDADRNPIYSLFATFTGGVLDAGPGNVIAPNFLSTSPPTISLSSVKIQLNVGASTAPLMSAGMPPGHLASENIDPALMSFQTASQPDAVNSGKMCADISAASLALGAIPAELLPPSQTACSEGYSMNNSMLDLLVGGCKIVIIQAINPVQPDKVDPKAAPAGAGGPYTLIKDAATKKVTGCTDKDGAAVNLAECLAAAAYSSYLRIATDRVILK